ncbi:hypothetical protein I350_00161 [Cryptococcus amylolentus CBS 6273]|uniref:Uncharacterized protein n=1 Tax=Cryptococcus amylolentus CBS 6273 TaxID=1296118 RepID=A0A1E3KGF7_9TREE|nr:hypothetical protein I350_00161 [Cryptococcus amylolentus CBS 6273]
MVIDADAYMEGNIPSLSRGGSWLPASHQTHNGSSSPLSPLHPSSVHGSSPLTATFPRTSPGPYGGSIAPGPGPLIRSPGMPMSPGSASMGGSMYSGKPMLRHLHGGMAASTAIHGLKRDHAVSPKSHTGWLRAGSEADDRSMAGSAYGGGSFDGRSLVSGAQSVSSSSSYHTRQYSHHQFDEHLPAEKGRSWEKNEGAPRLIAREKDYGLRRDPPVKVDGRLRRSSEVGEVATPYRKLEVHLVQQGAEDYFSKSHTPSQGVLSPKPSRRKASDPDLHRSAQLNSRLARMSLQGRECRTPDPEPSIGKRPTMSRRHTSHPHSSGESSQAPSSLPLSPPMHKQLNHIKRTRHNSTPPPPSSITTSFQDEASDYTAASTGPSLTSVISIWKCGSYIPVSAKVPMGYIPPLADDPYDRYASHPSSRTPDFVEKHLASSTLSPSTFSTSRLRPPQPKAEKAGEYTPPGFPKATKDFPWNRDGPAMKTYGIAWCRDGEADQLPLGPEGPRWTQARPPRVDHTMGGGWWESGGEDSVV